MMTNDEVMDHMRRNSALNQVRQVFMQAYGKIEQTQAQRTWSPVDIRRLEFEAVKSIIETACELGCLPGMDKPE